MSEIKICDNNWDDPSGGHTVETWESKQPGCLALSVKEQYGGSFQTCTLTPAICMALGMVLIAHAEANGVKIPRL